MLGGPTVPVPGSCPTAEEVVLAHKACPSVKAAGTQAELVVLSD